MIFIDRSYGFSKQCDGHPFDKFTSCIALLFESHIYQTVLVMWLIVMERLFWKLTWFETIWKIALTYLQNHFWMNSTCWNDLKFVWMSMKPIESFVSKNASCFQSICLVWDPLMKTTCACTISNCVSTYPTWFFQRYVSFVMNVDWWEIAYRTHDLSFKYLLGVCT